ncbi:hypothetical protein PRZ48_013550 [Zasmidium cellare]|uniref:Uncharacterized protein n=1 Tax=Zasmidium cellare TaxID=395010 RepID=A0ABR0E1Z0_ZASCE|nr:hypothetical protein PRZ48_013550 [Zasmidium cellare]
MPSFKDNTFVVLAVAALPSFAVATSVLFRAGAQCTDEITFGSTGLNKTVNCYDVTSFGDLPAVNVVNTTVGHQVKFYADDACQDLLVTATDDGCYVPAAGQSTFGSWEITSDQSDAGETAGSDKATSTSIDIKMSNYTGMGLTDPTNVDLTFSIPFIAAIVTGTAAVGLSFFAAYQACMDAAETKTVSDIIACVGTPLATILAATSAYFYSQSGNRMNARLNNALGTTSNLYRREEIDSALHEYVEGLTGGGSHVGYMIHQAHNLTGPMYEMEITPGQKYHVAAFYDQQSGSIINHLHTAEETELHTRDAPYPYNGIRWNAGGLDWNICAYNVINSMWNPNASSYYNAYYDQLNCIFGNRQEVYTAYGHMMVDIHDTNNNVEGEVQVIPYSGTYAGQTANACKPNYVVSVNGNCQIN